MKKRQNSRGMSFAKVVVVLVLALVVLFLILLMSGRSGEISKMLMKALAGEDDTNDPLCETHRIISSPQQLKELIVLTATGVCGGDTAESAFRFNLTDAYDTYDFNTNTPSDDFCGTHRYEVGGLNWTITFGDIEQVAVLSKPDTGTCWYSGESFFDFGLESQVCVGTNNADLIIAQDLDGVWFRDDPCTAIATAATVGCMKDDCGWLCGTSHLQTFGLDPLYNAGMGWDRPGQWAIRRAGEDTVICRLPTTGS